MRRFTGPAALALACALALAGCASGDPSATAIDPATDPDVVAATGTVMTGQGFVYTAPQGWAEPDASLIPAGVDSLVADMEDADGFADNLNVMRSPAGEVTAEQVESAGIRELEGAGATDVEAESRVVIAGEESAHLSAALTSSGVSYLVEQYYPSHDGQTYIVTFSFSGTVSEADRDQLASSVFATWKWS